MESFRQGDIVRVPFPYTDRSTRQFRPALVVSKRALGPDEALLWVVMITSAINRSWPDDVSLPSAADETGLMAASIVRPCKIATIDSRHANHLGRVSTGIMSEVLDRLKGYVF